MSTLKEGPEPFNIITLLTEKLGHPPTRQEAMVYIASLALHIANLYKVPDDAPEEAKQEALKTWFMTDRPDPELVHLGISNIVFMLSLEHNEELQEKLRYTAAFAQRCQSEGAPIRVTPAAS